MSQHGAIVSQRSMGTSPVQLAVIGAIRRARKKHPHYGPSYRELADDLGVTVNDVAQKVSRLVRDGLVAVDSGIARSIRELDDA